MLDSLARLDIWLLDQVFQKMADWWQDRTGKTNFWLAKVFGWSFAVAMLLLFMSRGFSSEDWLFLVVSFFMLFDFLDWEHKDLEAEAKPEFLNEDRASPMAQVFRLSTVAMTLYALTQAGVILYQGLGSVDPLTLCACLACTCFNYFGACTPRPPSHLRASNRLAAQATS